MIHFIDNFDFERAQTLDLEPRLSRLLAAQVAALTAGEHDLTAITEILVVEPGDTEEEIVQAVGFSPLHDPISGARHPDPAFQPGWAWLADLDGAFLIVWTVGNSGFAYLVLVVDADGVPADLLNMCRNFCGP